MRLGDRLVRFSTEKYEVSKESLKNSCVHLTNYSVNKLSDKFDDDEEEGMGHKWSISAFRDHLSKCGINDKLLFDRLCISLYSPCISLCSLCSHCVSLCSHCVSVCLVVLSLCVCVSLCSHCVSLCSLCLTVRAVQ